MNCLVAISLRIALTFSRKSNNYVTINENIKTMRHNNSKLQQLNTSCRVFYLLFQVKHIEKVDINARKNKIYSAKNSLFSLTIK